MLMVIAVSIITMLIVYFINPILGSEANFWYLASKPDSLTVINFFPDPPYHIIGMFILGLLIIIKESKIAVTGVILSFFYQKSRLLQLRS